MKGILSIVVAIFFVLIVALFGVAVYLHLECRKLEALLAESKPSGEEVTSVTAEPSPPQDEPLQDFQAEMTALEADRQRLEQEVAELKENCEKLREANTLTMEELAAVAPEAYEDFASELKEYYAQLRDVSNEWEMFRILEEDGLFKMKPEERQICEDYLTNYQEYVDGILNNIWSEEEAQERYQQLVKKWKDGYGKLYNETLSHALCEALGVATFDDEAERVLANTTAISDSFAMTPLWHYNILSNPHAREILKQDRPPLDYGLAQGEVDKVVQELEESFAARREQP